MAMRARYHHPSYLRLQRACRSEVSNELGTRRIELVVFLRLFFLLIWNFGCTLYIRPSLSVIRSTLEKKNLPFSLSFFGPVQADHLINLRTVVTAAASAHACHFRVIWLSEF